MNEYFKEGFKKTAGPLLIDISNVAGRYGDEWESTKEKRGERQALLEALVRGKKMPSKTEAVETSGNLRTPESWVGYRLG